MIYAGNAGDRNERGMRGAVALGTMIGETLGVGSRIVGTPTPVVEGGWRRQLQAASPNLRLLAAEFTNRFDGRARVIGTLGRCAASLATLPLVARRCPDAAIIWFDAHGDSNVPIGAASEMNYLGGMVITGASGEWESGFGAGLDLANVILVGARDLDPPERARIENGQLKLIEVGPGLAERLAAAIGNRQIYIHLDCDVLEAGLLATEYQSASGLSFDMLHEAFSVLAQYDVLGLEIAEYEDCWPDNRPNSADMLLDAIKPVLCLFSAR